MAGFATYKPHEIISVAIAALVRVHGALHRSLLILILLCTVNLSKSQEARAQAARVQFIHASPYAEAAVIDVYRNGELWLDDFVFTRATPFTDWPDGRRFRLDFVYSLDPDNSNPFFSETLILTAGERYYVVAAGDPRGRVEQPAFQLHVQPGALERSPYGPFPASEGVSVVPDAPRYGNYWRGNIPEQFKGRLTSVYPNTKSYGEFSGYVTAPAVMFDGDIRAEMGEIIPPPYPTNLVDDVLRMKYGVEAGYEYGAGSFYGSFVIDFATKEYQAFIMVDTGFIHPPRENDAKYVEFMVLTDGTIEENRPNTAHLQWINNSPYVETEIVDIYINGFLVVEDLDFRHATPFIELPSGLQDFSAPILTIDVTSADAIDNSAPLFSEDITLIFEERYVGVISGDPYARDGQSPMGLFVYEGWRENAADSGRVDILFSHGVPDMIAANIGIEGEPLPLAGYLRFGEFAASTSLPVVDDTLYISHADTRVIAAGVEPQLRTRSLADSAIVVLTSGFVNPPDGIASHDSELALVAALPSGGALLRFVMKPPPPWYQKPWVYLVGLFVLALVALAGNQVRILRLRSRERELSELVEERTRELVAEKQKTEAQSERLLELDEAKNRFFANISHEFRTPLTLILGPLQDAIDGNFGSFDKRFQKQLRLMRRNSRRLLRLVNQLLDLSRLESGKMELHSETGDIKRFTRDLTYSFVPSAERKHVVLKYESEVDELITEFDTDALEKILTNLLANALKFTPEGGQIHVNLKQAVDSWVEINVTDTGPGIDDDYLERIFERFQQADTSIRREHEGTGIGLALAKELTELHGGHLLVESKAGHGSTFTVRLPIPERVFVHADATTATGVERDEGDSEFPDDEIISPSESDLPVTQTVDGEQATILIVEDNSDVRTYIRRHLESLYELLEAEDGELGLEAARHHEPDLILSDVMMPKMDGYEMCRLLKANENLRHIPVIMLTAKATEEDTLEGLGSGADDYIAKPFNMPELLAKIANLISIRQEMRTRFSREIVVKPADITITPEEEVFLDRVVDAINAHLGDSGFTTDWLADEVSLSRRQLDRRVLAVTGETPADLVRRMRLERASQLLRAHVGTVSETAYAVGFRSPAHFSRLFRQTFGVAPSDISTEKYDETAHD